MNEIKIASHDGYQLHCYIWDDVVSPKGVFQITHGMAEHALRYERFAKFLNANGYIVFANDIRAHGKSAGSVDKVGLVVEGDLFDETVRDQILLSEYLVNEYHLPIYLMGHSYGSFITQQYIQQCQIPKAVILMGSAYQKGALTTVGSVVANLTSAFKGKDAPAKMIVGLSFGEYEKCFEDKQWVTSNTEESQKYNDDPYCGKMFSAGFYKYFFKHLNMLYTKDGLAKIPKDYPLYIVSGALDPVGGQGVLTTKLYDMYKENGLNNVDIKLYPNMRHEILNEIGSDEPMNDILNFINNN